MLDGLWHDAHLQADRVREAGDAVVLLGASVRGFLG